MDAGQLSQFILRDSDLLSAVFDFFSYGHSYRPPCIEMATLYHVLKKFSTSISKYLTIAKSLHIMGI